MRESQEKSAEDERGDGRRAWKPTNDDQNAAARATDI